MPTAGKTISEVFEEFLTEQEARLSPSTFSKYGSIISLLESYLESYGPGHDQEAYSRIAKQGGTYCGTFAPDEIPDSYSEFLGYFMPRKVVCGKDTLKAAGTVTKKLAKWLAEKGYVKDTADAQKRARKATRELPATQKVLDLLAEYADYNAPGNFRDTLDDHFTVEHEKIEPGKLWLEPLSTSDGVIGPVPVPVEVTKLCQPCWDISGTVVKTSRGWRFWEVRNVSP
jgi:hypothetical protein